MKKRIALFDFDGTLTRRDTFIDFHIRRFGRSKVLSASLYALSRAKFSRTSLKEAFIRRLWAGASYSDYLADAEDYAKTRVEKNLLPRAMNVFLGHLACGDDVWIVTASMRDWVEFWAEGYGVPVIGTELEVSGGILTGRLSTPNCRGAEKVARIREAVDLSAYVKIFAYGNSGGDRQMLDIADEAVYRWNRDVAL
jgi:HAD superfamily hydrolase (TIGR01490 family)